MFPSSSNNCDHFPFTNQAMFTENENPSSSQQHHHHQHHLSPFLHFPADQPFLADDNELFMSHFFSQQQILGYSSNNDVVAETEIKMASPVLKPTKKTTTKKTKNAGDGEKQAVPRKRTGKKDRHSKIYTAKGPRDRRMRLSLQIARKFFDLQDMLGFDKASKTIEWLFSKSKAAIKELTESFPSVKKSCTGGAKSLSSTSESEVLSGINKKSEEHKKALALAVADSLVGISRGGTMNRKSRKAIINPIVRESRDKARARARERTVEKLKMKMTKGLDQKSKKCSDQDANPNDLVAEEEDEESGMVHLPEHDEMDSVSIIEKFLGITTSPRSSSIFDYTHNIGESSGASSQQNHPEYNSYCAMTNMKGSSGSGNVVLRAQNPGEFFNISPDTQERESRSIYMSNSGANAHDQNPSSDSNKGLSNAHDQNPSSDFNKGLSNAHEQNPSSIVMTSQPYFLEDQFSCNPIVDNKYSSLY